MMFEKLLQTVEQKQKHSKRYTSIPRNSQHDLRKTVVREEIRKEVEVIHARDECIWFAS